MTVSDLLSKLSALDPTLPVRLDVTLRRHRTVIPGAFTAPAGDIKLWSYWNGDMDTTEPCLLIMQTGEREPQRLERENV